MDFSQEIPPFLFGDAPLKDSGSAFLIKLSLVDSVGFGSPHYAACLILVLGEFLPSEVGEEWFCPRGDEAIIMWAEGVISLAEPPIVSECSVSGSAVESGLLLFGFPSHTTDGLNSLSKKMLGGLHHVLRRCVPGHLPPDYFPGLYGEIQAL